MASPKEIVRLAASGDLHYPKASQGLLQRLFSGVGDEADVLLLCGDLTDTGVPEEARNLAKELSGAVKIPIIAVLGNHEYEAGKQDEVRQILADAGITVLDGEVCEVHGVGFAGVKGFGGGFGERALQAWGEESTKRFVREAVEEALKLESALARLRTPQRVALLHYAPVPDTVQGEPPEIYPFLGSSRLEEPLARYPVVAVFHGHAHNGRPEGRLRGDVPVYNVAAPLLARAFPERPPFRVIEIKATSEAGVSTPESASGDRPAAGGSAPGYRPSLA